MPKLSRERRRPDQPIGLPTCSDGATLKPRHSHASQIQVELESVKGAIRGTPLAEPDGPGPLLAEEIGRFETERESSKAITLTNDDRSPDLGFDADDEPDGDSRVPAPVFWTPPNLDPESFYRSLGGGREGEYLQQSKLLGVDAYGYYASFHQRTYQWGVYVPIEGVAALAKHALGDLDLDSCEKFHLAWDFIVEHERFHYAADCGIGQLELLLEQPIWWPVREHILRPEVIELEEELATAFGLRAVMHLPLVRARRGVYHAFKEFSKTLPSGYNVGHHLAHSRFRLGNRISNLAQANVHSAMGRDFPLVEMHHLYPAFRPHDLLRCPVHLLVPPGIGGATLVQRIDRIVEEDSFLKELSRYAQGYVEKWKKTKHLLAASVLLKGLDFKPWPKIGRNWFSVRIDRKMRAHLRFDASTETWFAEQFGPHTKMGHG
jgi:hypothetical protein